MTEQSEYLYVLRPTRPGMVTAGPTEREGDVLAQHFAYLQELARRDVVLLAGRTRKREETDFGIVVFRADSEGSAREIMDGDPAVKAGIMRAELYPYRVALMAGRA